MSVHFGIVGAMGRMGQAIARASLQNNQLSLAKAFEAQGHPALQQNYAQATGIHVNAQLSLSTISSEDLSQLNGVIDFSRPEAALNTASLCADKKTPLVIGTTGFTSEQQGAIKQAAQKTAVLLSSNMSIGVNLLFALTRQAARSLHNKNFDPEVTEIHHKLKKDAPSGTARSLEEIILAEYGWGSDSSCYGREGIIGERPQKQLGVFALRGGDVVGEHTVFFFGEGERIELKHQATSRETFAAGALSALLFLQGKPPGLYSMADVLGVG